MMLPRLDLGLMLTATLAVPSAQADHSTAEGKVIQAVTVVSPTPGQTVSGQVWFTDENGSSGR